MNVVTLFYIGQCHAAQVVSRDGITKDDLGGKGIAVGGKGECVRAIIVLGVSQVVGVNAFHGLGGWWIFTTAARALTLGHVELGIGGLVGDHSETLVHQVAIPFGIGIDSVRAWFQVLEIEHAVVIVVGFIGAHKRSIFVELNGGAVDGQIGVDRATLVVVK